MHTESRLFTYIRNFLYYFKLQFNVKPFDFSFVFKNIPILFYF